MAKIIEEFFVAAYNRKDGTAGFLGYDVNSGGYLYFSDTPDYRNLHDDIADAVSDVEMIQTSMKTYSRHETVDFSTARVVRYQISIEEIANLEVVIHENLVANAKAKLSDDELAALRDEIGE